MDKQTLEHWCCNRQWVKGETVNDYMQKPITILSLETPLLDAIDDILANDFSIVTDGIKQDVWHSDNRRHLRAVHPLEEALCVA